MSHVATYKNKVANIDRLKKIAKEKGYSTRENVTVNLFGANKIANATAIKLPGWRYEVAITHDGSIMYDFFGSDKGEGVFEQLGELLQETDRQAIWEEMPIDYTINCNIQEEFDEDKSYIMTIEF